jgi:hypothetical protein
MAALGIAAGVAAGVAAGAAALGVSLAIGAVLSFDFVDEQAVVINSAATAATHKTRTCFFEVFIRRSPGGLTAIKSVDPRIAHNSIFILHHCWGKARTFAGHAEWGRVGRAAGSIRRRVQSLPSLANDWRMPCTRHKK